MAVPTDPAPPSPSPSPLAEAIATLTLGPRQGGPVLGVYPLFGVSGQPVEYDLARDGFEAGTLVVTEVSESGTVPVIRVRNDGPRPALFLDGEELVGAKQNRVLNVTVMVAAETVLDVPVSCVEAGRWRHRTAGFRDSDWLMDAEGRGAKMREVTERMRTSRSRNADQQAVWSRVDAKARALGADSDTSAMHDTFARHAVSMNELLSQLVPLPGQVGAVFEVRGRVVGLEVFDAEAPFRKVFPKLARSYALDALDPRRGSQQAAPGNGAGTLLEAVSEAQVESYPALGLGRDLRLHQGDLHGGGLMVGESLVHLAALRMA